MKILKKALIAFLVSALIAGCGDDNDGDFVVTGQQAQGNGLVTYRVTITNLTSGQPFSPPIAATHSPTATNLVFQVGANASAELAAIAQDGNQQPMAALLGGLATVTQVADPGAPLTFAGNQVTLPNNAVVTDTLTFQIQGAPGDIFSLASMLIATNDGFFGLNGVALPATGTATYTSNAYDAGVENNTELSVDIVDPASVLGPVALNGDPNGNSNAAVTNPATAIVLHPNIQGVGDLSQAMHTWTDPVARITIERL